MRLLKVRFWMRLRIHDMLIQIWLRLSRRRILDRLVGCRTFSTTLEKIKYGLSAGRVPERCGEIDCGKKGKSGF